MSDKLYTLISGDCLEKMKDIPDGSVDMILCDLPYGTTACKWDALIPFAPLWAEYRRVCKPNAAIVLTGSQPFTSALIMSNLQDFKYALVWAKTRNSHPFFAKIRPLPQHEDVLVFCRGKHIYNPQMEKSDKPYKINAAAGKLRGDEALKKWEGESKVSNERCPTSVIRISNSSSEAGLHPTQKPVALMEYLVKTYTGEGQTVLDNCFGSCSTGVACLNTNRRFIGIERDPTYFEIGSKRISEAFAARTPVLP